jgi:hypothetical protein
MQMFWFALKCAAGALAYLLLWWFFPKAALFVISVAPLSIMGMNFVYLLIFLYRCEKDSSTPILHVCEVTSYVILIAMYYGYTCWEILMTQAPPDVDAGFVGFITTVVLLSGCLLGMYVGLIDGHWGKVPDE